MTFISNKIESDYQPSEGYTYKENFWDVYSAGLGHVIDENLSISRQFNNEARIERKKNIQQMVESGELGREVIDANRDRRGRVDYDRIAKALNDERVKTDAQLDEEKNEVLRIKREYAQRTMEKGSGGAAFIGQTQGYMLDPINVASMFAGGAGIVKSGLSTGQAVFRAGVRGGTIAATSEALIQPFVFDYKQEIDSPYSFEDSLMAITTAAIGGAALDSTITGLKSYFTRVKADINKLEADGYDVPQEVIAAKQKIDELEVKLSEISEKDFSADAVNKRVLDGTADDIDLDIHKKYNAIQEDILSFNKQELIATSGNKLSRGDVKKLKSELETINKKIKDFQELTAQDIGINKQKGVSARKSKKAAADEAARQNKDAINELENIKRGIEQKLELNESYRKAEAELSRLEQGILSDDLKNKILEEQEAIRMNEVKRVTKSQLEEIKKTRAQELEYNSPKPKVEMNQKPRLKVKSGQDLTGNARIKKEMESQGLLDDYNTELEQFNQIEDVQIEIEGYTGSSKEYAKMMDDEVETVEQLSRCAIG